MDHHAEDHSLALMMLPSSTTKTRPANLVKSAVLNATRTSVSRSVMTDAETASVTPPTVSLARLENSSLNFPMAPPPAVADATRDNSTTKTEEDALTA